MNVARLFPISDVKIILDENYIATAQPNMSDPAMYHLFHLWKAYVEPTVSITCNLCYARIIKNYRELQPEFIEIVKEHNILNDLT